MAGQNAPQVGITQRLPSPGNVGAGTQSSPASGTQPSQPKRAAQRKSTTFHIRPGKGGDVKVVKIEFLIGLVMLIMAPLANKDLHFNKNYVKRLLAFVLLFAGLFALADARDPSVSRLASGLGGLLILTLAVMQPANGFGVKFATLLATIVQKLQPSK